MEEITSHGFDDHIRRSLLNSGHSFDTEKLNHARNLFNHALIETRHTVLKKEHFDDAVERMKKHPEWNRLTSSQQEAFVSTMRNSLKIKEPEQEDAA